MRGSLFNRPSTGPKVCILFMVWLILVVLCSI